MSKDYIKEFGGKNDMFIHTVTNNPAHVNTSSMDIHIDCLDCKNCIDCKNCQGCKNCISCEDCINCINCVECRHCTNLANRKNQTNVKL